MFQNVLEHAGTVPGTVPGTIPGTVPGFFLSGQSSNLFVHIPEETGERRTRDEPTGAK